MASTASISGLSSGLDTASIIDQLMQLEAQPQTNLKTKVSTEQSLVTKLQTVNTKAALLASKAAALAKATTWQATTGTSSNSSVAVTAASTAAATRLSLTVTSVARTHQLGFASSAQLSDNVTGSASTKVSVNRYDGTPVELDTGDGTLQGLVSAINDSANATGLRATAIKSSDGYRLLVESTATGAASDFDLTRADGTALLGGATVRAGTDAVLDLGTGITVTSTSNTFADLTPGVSITLAPDTAVGATATVTVKKDAAKLTSAVGDLVSSMNDLIAGVATETAYDASTKTSGALAGEGAVRSLGSSVLSTVFSSDNTTLAKVGIQTDRSGRLTFDATTFAAAYAADPDGVAKMFTTGDGSSTDGFAARVATVAKSTSDPSTGTLTSAITSHTSGITQMQSRIDTWDTTLELRRAGLQAQYTALETALSSMKSQSSWLASQLSSLSSS